MTAQDRRRVAVPCLAVGICLACAAGCTRNSLRPPAATAQQELQQALAASGRSLPGADRPGGESPDGSSSATEVSENLLRGHREADAGRLDQAARYYERVLRVDPRHPVAHHRLGVIADQNRDFAAAERHYSAALEVRPDDPDVLNDLGYCYLLQDRYPESERTLREAVALAPTHERALTNLGMLYGKIGDPDRAYAVLRLTGSDEEARAKLALLVRTPANLSAQSGILAPPLTAATGGAVLQAGAVARGGAETAYAPAGLAPNSPMQDLMVQLDRAKQEAYAERTARTAPGRLPGLIDPAEVPRGGPPQAADVQPYTRSPRDPYLAARLTADGTGYAANNAPAPASDQTSGELPLWSPPPGARPPSSASLPPSGSPIVPASYTARQTGDMLRPAAAAGLAPGLPAPLYSPPQQGTVAAGYSASAPYGARSATGSAPSSPAAAVGHSPVTDYAEPGLRAYAEDLARRDAEATDMHQYTQTDARSQAGDATGYPAQAGGTMGYPQ